MLTLPLPRPLLRHPQPHALAACPCITDLPRRSCGSIASPSTRTWSGNQIRAQKNTSHETPEPPLLARTLTVLCCGLCLQTGPCGAFAQDITQSPSGRAWASKQPKAPVQSTAERASTVLRLSSEAYAATDSLQFEQALTAYTTITRNYNDLALSQYAHVGRALMLYEMGQQPEGLSELKAMEPRLRGYAEVHAALAVMLYSEQPPALSRAESQWELAGEFDSRFADVSWVARERHWPPSMVAALQHFLAMS